MPRHAPRSLTIAVLLPAALVLCGLAPCGAAFAQPAAGSVFTVARVPVKAEAADAVKAKQQAIAAGQRQAMEKLLLRLTAFNTHGQLPQFSDMDVQRVVSGMQVRGERNSATVYLATIDFTFSPEAVKMLLGQNGIAFVTDRAPEVQILPLYVEGGAVKPGDKNLWTEALAKCDLRNGLTPAKLVQPAAGVQPAQLAAAAADPAKAFPALQTQMKGKLVLAVAEMDPKGGALTVKLAGMDATGLVKLQHKYKISGGDAAGVTEDAAKVALGTIENRWKLTRVSAQGATDSYQGGTAPYQGGTASYQGGNAPYQGGTAAYQDPGQASYGQTGARGLDRVTLTAEFNGLKEWQTIKAKLQKLPGVQNFDVATVNPRGAAVSLDFPGGADQLARVAANDGLALEGGEGAWVLRLRK